MKYVNVINENGKIIFEIIEMSKDHKAIQIAKWFKLDIKTETIGL